MPAQRVFEQMQSRGIKPDIVAFSTLITAYERAGEWRKALEVVTCSNLFWPSNLSAMLSAHASL